MSKVTDMSYMFQGADSFNQPLNKWNVSKVTNMGGMFYDASSFNQPLNNWNVSTIKLPSCLQLWILFMMSNKISKLQGLRAP